MHTWTAEAISQPEIKFEGKGDGEVKEILAEIKEFLVRSGLKGKCSEVETFKVKLLDHEKVVDAWRMTSKPPRGKQGKEMVAKIQGGVPEAVKVEKVKEVKEPKAAKPKLVK